jgi:hypothetical protein
MNRPSVNYTNEEKKRNFKQDESLYACQSVRDIEIDKINQII